MKQTLILLFFCASCSHSLREATIRKIPVESAAEGRNVIKNQVSFLADIFIQSRDPYYNLPKWTEACLAGNKVGTLDEKTGIFRSTSELWLRSNEAGYCPGKEGTIRSWVIFEYCPTIHEVREVKAPVAINPGLDRRSVCP